MAVSILLLSTVCTKSAARLNQVSSRSRPQGSALATHCGPPRDQIKAGREDGGRSKKSWWPPNPLRFIRPSAHPGN